MTNEFIDHLLKNYPQLLQCRKEIEQTIALIEESFSKQGKLLVCGNGGSAADSEHIVGELMKGFLQQRNLPKELKNRINEQWSQDGKYMSEKLQMGLPAISLVSQTALLTAFSNDQAADLCFAQQVLGYGTNKDCLLCISTSGNSKNVIYAAKMAKSLGMKVVSLTGDTGGELVKCSDSCIIVPESETYRIQEMHLPIYHVICSTIEFDFFK